MKNQDNVIGIYYYTAWNGYAWQGCDEAEARSLQRYMEATGTLPKSSTDVPPWGGAVACKLAGKVGVAVYRYHVRRNGDLSGRDSLYIALAFIPLGIMPSGQCVDLRKILVLRQLSEPKQGELQCESIPLDGMVLSPESHAEKPRDWLDGELDQKYRALRGAAGLWTLSHVFFSRYAHLGFLSAVFNSEGKIEDVAITLNYSVYPEVEKVAAAFKQLDDLGSGSNVAIDGVRSALAGLKSWADKQPDYYGLKNYHDTRLEQLNGEANKIELVRKYASELQRVLGEIKGDGGSSAVFDDSAVLAKCEKMAEDILSMPIIDDCAYKDALTLSLEAMYTVGGIRGEKKVRNKAEVEFQGLEKQIEELKSSLKQDVSGGIPVDAKTCITKPKPVPESVHGETGSAKMQDKCLDQAAEGPCTSSWWPESFLDWILTLLCVVAASAVVFLIILFSKALFPSRPAGNHVAPAPVTNTTESADSRGIPAANVTLETPEADDNSSSTNEADSVTSGVHLVADDADKEMLDKKDMLNGASATNDGGMAAEMVSRKIDTSPGVRMAETVDDGNRRSAYQKAKGESTTERNERMAR